MRYCPLSKEFEEDCGECEMCQDDEWAEHKEERKAKKQDNKVKSLNILADLGIRWQKFSEVHYRIGIFDFWPTTGKWWNRRTNEKGRGVFGLVKEIKKLTNKK